MPKLKPLYLVIAACVVFALVGAMYASTRKSNFKVATFENNTLVLVTDGYRASVTLPNANFGNGWKEIGNGTVVLKGTSVSVNLCAVLGKFPQDRQQVWQSVFPYLNLDGNAPQADKGRALKDDPDSFGASGTVPIPQGDNLFTQFLGIRREQFVIILRISSVEGNEENPNTLRLYQDIKASLEVSSTTLH